MGTDISLYAEVKRDGVWHLIGGLEENPEYYPEENSQAQRFKPISIYDVRNYNLFAILADVRNPNARTLNGQKFEVIAPTRGLPEDLCPEIRHWSEGWRGELFSPSWLSLSEILRFDWHRKRMHFQAMVDARVAPLFQPNKPFPLKSWPKDIPIGYGAYLKDGVTVCWADTYAASVGEPFLNAMEGLKTDEKPSRLRLVFWFDQ